MTVPTGSAAASLRRTPPQPTTDGRLVAPAEASARPYVATVVFGVATIYLVVYGAMQLGAFGSSWGSSASPFLGPLTYLPFALLAIAMCWDASRRRTLSGAVRRAWMFLALTFAAESLQVSTQVVSALYGWRPMVDTKAQALSFSIDALRYAFTFAAILSFRRNSRRAGASRTTFLLDIATVGIAAAVLGWHVELRGLAAETNASVWRSVFTITYPVASLATMFGFAVLVMQRPAPQISLPIRLLAFGLLVNVVTDAAYMQMLARGHAPNGGALFIVYAAIDWFHAGAGLLQSWIASRREEPAPVADETPAATSTMYHRALASTLPYAAIVAMFGVLLLEANQVETHGTVLLALHRTAVSTGRPLTMLVLGAIAITIVVMARQIAVQRHNAMLVADRLEREAHFRALVQHASDVFLVLDAAGFIREASPAVARVLGRAPALLVGRPLTDFVAEQDVALAQADLAQAEAVDSADGNGRQVAPCEWRVRHADGRTRWLEVICTNLLHDPAVAGIVVNGRDVTERKVLEAELTHQAFHDSLTGLINRVRFGAAVSAALKRSPEIEPGRAGLAVLYIDLDRFKPINDAHGHAAGDAVLVAVAGRLLDATRGSDTLARLGGDEFGILLERVRSREEALLVADRVVRLLGGPVSVCGTIVHVGASVGVAYLERGAATTSATAILVAADHAMYTAKAEGGSRHSVVSV
jgi:diguanylate cyclase (GGDEF)-like protein/PAS domain S-box-containing protein